MDPIIEALKNRSHGQCELCAHAKITEQAFSVSPENSDILYSVFLCNPCLSLLKGESEIQEKDWRSTLHQSIWSDISAVKIISWFLLQKLNSQGWAQDLLSQMYLTEEETTIADSFFENNNPDTNELKTDEPNVVDSNGAILREGDSVILIKDLNVKGASFTAKRGTLVKGIHLTNNPLHVEGRVNGTLIVIITQFVKKA